MSRILDVCFLDLSCYEKYVDDFLHGLFSTDVVEGGLADQQLVGEHA